MYAKEPEEYDTFITPEAYFAIKEWMDHRASSGEKMLAVNPGQRVTSIGRGNVNNPKRMSPEVIKQLIERAMIAAGLRPPLPDGVRRYEFKVSHGFRKFHYRFSIDFKIGEYLAKILAGHSIGLGASYSKHKMEEYLEKSLKVVDDLTIERDVRDEHARQIGQIKEEQIRKDMQMQQSMETKDMEIQALKEDIKAMRADMKNIFEVLRIAKQNDGRIGKDRTMLDEDRNISFCEDYEDGGTRVVKIPIDSVQIEDQKPL